MPAVNSANPLDFFDVRSALSEDEQMVQDTVARFTDEKVLPMIPPGGSIKNIILR